MQDDKFIEEAYNRKESEYYERSRPEMQELVPNTCKALLDVGCGTGAFARAIKARLNCETWGIEPHPAAASVASKQMDHVIHGLFAVGSGLPEGRFDCISFNDVLEHMSDPESALRYARTLLRPKGCIIASIPNVSHFPVVWKLVMRGNWEYADQGILDRTHMRFYTRESIRELFHSTGYSSVTLAGINSYMSIFPSDRHIWRYYKILRILPRASISDMKYLQFSVRATID